MDRCKSDWK